MRPITASIMTKRAKFTPEDQQRRIAGIFRAFDHSYPHAICALVHRNAFELLVATILSAQCTDERVNIVTRELFKKYRGPRDIVSVAQEVLETDIRSTGFFRNKAKNLQGACRMILERFGGKVPDTMEALVQLPGVARKTANVVLGVSFGKAEGVVVDTHVSRLSRRLELSSAEAPEKIEADLMALIPRDRWIVFSHQMILHGRKICQARKPLCAQCPVESICRSEDKTPRGTRVPRGLPGKRAMDRQ
jgi:endonuclease-3